MVQCPRDTAPSANSDQSPTVMQCSRFRCAAKAPVRDTLEHSVSEAFPAGWGIRIRCAATLVRERERRYGWGGGVGLVRTCHPASGGGRRKTIAFTDC